MYIAFNETFNVPIGAVFSYFETPAHWASLYGAVQPSQKRADGWYSIPLQKFPFPLVAKNVELVRNRNVRWIFGGFWRGVGEVKLSDDGERTTVDGFEYICPHGLWLLAPWFERRFMEREFVRIWEIGWKRIRKHEHQAPPEPDRGHSGPAGTGG